MSKELIRYSKSIAMLVIVFGAAVSASAETPSVAVTAVETPPTVRSAAELEALVAPIALYPDDLLAIALPASTYPVQVVQAARLLETARAGSSVTPDEAWDDSVVALMNYPEVVQLMDRDLDWTWDLGDAVLNQQAEVLDAVERFRARAHAAGNLKTDERQVVTVTPDVIQIAPADPKVIYVPYYEPARVTVYQRLPVYHYYPVGYPVYYYPYPLGYAFDSGYFWGVTSVYRLGWHTHHVHVHPYHSHYHPYYGYRYYNHYYRKPWRGWNDNQHQQASYWNKNDRNSRSWNGNRHGGQGFDRRDNFDQSDAWRHDPSRGGARQHDRNRFQRDGGQHQATTFANARNRFDRDNHSERGNDRTQGRRDSQPNANRLPLPTDRTAFRSSTPDIRTRQANEPTQAQSRSGSQRNQMARAGSQNQHGLRERQRDRNVATFRSDAPQTSSRQRWQRGRENNQAASAENRRQAGSQFPAAENASGRRQQFRSAQQQQARPMVAQAPREQRSNDGASPNRSESRQREGNRGSNRHEVRASAAESRSRAFGSHRRD